MKIHAFIFNWRGHFDRTLQIEAQIGKLVRTTVINSEEGQALSQKAWYHLGDSAYFSAQWNKALELFDGDLMFHIQADAGIGDAEVLIEKAISSVRKYDLGVYEPEIENTGVYYNERSRLQELAPDLLVVPRTDCTCWFIHADVLRQFSPVNLTVNKFGWGIDMVIAAQCSLLGRRCARDYSISVKHPKSRGYSTHAARSQLEAYRRTLDPEVSKMMLQLWRQSKILNETKMSAFGKLLRFIKNIIRRVFFRREMVD